MVHNIEIIDKIIADISSAAQNVKNKPEQEIKDKYEFNYLMKSLKRAEAVRNSTLFYGDISLPILLGELKHTAERTIAHNSPLGVHRAAHKILKITKKYL